MNSRAAVLRQNGCEVTSVFGNEAAKQVLSFGAVDYELFMVGHDAPEAQRRDMIIWLKRRYPNAKVLALNPPDSPHLTDADFNIIQDGPEKWLAVIAAM